MNSSKRTIFNFHGGLLLDEHKSTSTSRPIETAPIPPLLILPLVQHIGDAAKPCVKIGDKVLKNQCIANADSRVSARIHASSSGTVVAIEKHAIPHPSNLDIECIVIETDGRDTSIEPDFSGVKNVQSLSIKDIRQQIQAAGIVGLGGAGFPSHIKLDANNSPVETLILNAAECEPYISCDDMLMREHAEEIINGMRIMQYVLNAKHCLIGIEDNKVEAYAALKEAIHNNDDIELIRVPTRYPAGGERQLIYSLTGQQAPSQGRPLDIGVVCHNVGTAYAVNDAITEAKPLTSRVVTLTGTGIPQPRNMHVRLGTPIQFLLEHCHSSKHDIGNILIGGPMMGFNLNSSEAPITKTCNCVLVTHQRDVTAPATSLACIRCGDCADVCPVNLLPQQLYWHAHAQEFDAVQDYYLFDCIECGCCDVVCPSRIPLVQYFRFAKTTIWQQERDKEKSDKARQRHELRLERLEREKREKRERHNRKKTALKKSPDQKEDPKKAAILAAMKRVQEKKNVADTNPSNTDNLSQEQQAKVDEADARRKKQNKDTPPS